MKANLKIKSISFKLGIWFSIIFIVLLFILGTILYGVFTSLFVDYIKQDLLARGNNHARILNEQFNSTTIEHVIQMEKGATTNVIITDPNKNILASSITPNMDMKNHILIKANIKKSYILESDWQNHDYIISVSPIGKNKGLVFMYYSATILREIVFVSNILMIVTSLGIILLAFGIIGILSQRLTKPLQTMKEATNKMALGKYNQQIPIKGYDEIAQLGYSVQKLGEQLQFFENSRNEFLAAVSHELRTPLTYIKGYSDILSKGTIHNSEEQNNYLKIIHKEANRLSFLVNDLFEMSKLQLGKFEINREYANINLVIKKVISNLKPAAEKKGLQLNVICDSDILFTHIDIQRIEQVIYNLIENAIKYTQKGEITVHSYSKNEFVVIDIKDTGIGIPKEELKKIWERFYRVEQSRTRKMGGTGLGLYVVKQIIESHNGYIEVNSTENVGSIFTIYLKGSKSKENVYEKNINC